MNARVVACRATADYRLHLRFSDGLQGSVYLGNLLSIGAFTLWRDGRVFMTAQVDQETGAVVWRPAGIRLDPDILYHDLALREPCIPLPAPRPTELAFQRFMRVVLEAPGRRRRK